MTFCHAVMAAAVAFSSLSPALARDTSVSLQDRRQAACYDDAHRLCGDLIPDVAKVTACMKTKRAEVSPKCAAMYKVKK